MLNQLQAFDADPQAIADEAADTLLTDEQARAEDARRRADRLQVFSARLASQRDEYVRARAAAGWDKRWREDLNAYEGRDDGAIQVAQMMESVQQGYPVMSRNASPTRSTVYIGLTRVKTTQAESRVAEILFPSDDRNWGIEPTPDPKLAKAQTSDEIPLGPNGRPFMGRDGQPLRKRDLAEIIRRMAQDAAERMQNKIDDQLSESDFNGEARKVIHNAAKLGTGILKGPLVIEQTNRVYLPQVDPANGQRVHVVHIDATDAPASFSVNPQNIFPDPACGDDPKRGKGIFEMDRLTARQVRDLAKQPHYIADQLRSVLEEGPKQPTATADVGERIDVLESAKETFEKWEYWGEVDYEDLVAAGAQGLPNQPDPLQSFHACVVMINDRVCKAYLNPLADSDHAIPYDFFRWSKVDGQPFGYGVPRLMASQQKVLNSAWRALMDNMGISSGPMIIIDPTAVTPADRNWTLGARKIWIKSKDSTDDVNKVFQSVEFASHQPELANIISMAERLADVELGLPQMMAGDQGNAPDTVGGMTLLYNTANTLLRRIVKGYDDDITRPHIRRYYDFNMLYSDDEDIKGDFRCLPRGSSALLMRDQQNQEFLQLLAFAQSPVYGPLVDPKKLFEKALQARYVDPAEIMRSDEELAAMKKQPASPPPQLAVAQIRANADMAKARSDAQTAERESQTRLAMLDREHALRMAELQVERETEILKMANQRQMSLDQIKAMLGATAIKERTRRDLFSAEQRLKLQMGSGI